MAIPITVPRLGWNMEEGVFHGWLKKEGDPVRPGDALFSLEAEKSTQDIESMDSGILRLIAGRSEGGRYGGRRGRDRLSDRSRAKQSGAPAPRAPRRFLNRIQPPR